MQGLDPSIGQSLGSERYSFTWNGKRRAGLIAQAPPDGTLRPCPEQSVNWDTTRNLFIEGDNLEVLKLLQKSYHKKVKMIYIDPPYNTGKDFVYRDDFTDSIQNYLRLTGQVDEAGRRLSANPETCGRYHTNWLNMMYPRMRLARNLLRDDGVIAISIDDHELANLRKMCDEVFGEENFCGVFIWEKKKKPSFLDANMGTVTEYIICFAKNRAQSPPFGAGAAREGKKYPFNNAGNGVQTLTFPAGSVRFGFGDQVVAAQDMSEGSIFTELLDDVAIVGGRNANAFRLRGEWRYSQQKLDEFVEEGADIVISKIPFRPNYVSRSGELKKTSNLLSYRTNGVPTYEDATQEIRALFGADVMSYPKPSGLMKYLVRAMTGEGDIVMDFFAGSGSTAHGVMLQNSEDGYNRQYILVQLPEPLKPDDAESGPAFEFCRAHGLSPTIAEIGKERIRRAATAAAAGAVERGALGLGPEFGPGLGAGRGSGLDLGFRVFRLDSSNLWPWDSDPRNLEESLLQAVERIKDDRQEADVLYELVIQYGLDLAASVERREIDGKAVYIVGEGELVVCLADHISSRLALGIARLRAELAAAQMQVVLRDAGFDSDADRINTIQVLRGAGVESAKTL
jgi:adenine-specific DNA-methyltransferase